MRLSQKGALTIECWDGKLHGPGISWLKLHWCAEQRKLQHVFFLLFPVLVAKRWACCLQEFIQGPTIRCTDVGGCSHNAGLIHTHQLLPITQLVEEQMEALHPWSLAKPYHNLHFPSCCWTCVVLWYIRSLSASGVSLTSRTIRNGWDCFFVFTAYLPCIERYRVPICSHHCIS